MVQGKRGLVEATGGMKMEKEFFIVPQKVAIRKGEKFLVVKRAPDAKVYPDCWDFPGGKLEWGEDPKQGLKREVKEETKLEVEIKNPEFAFSERIKDHFIYLTVFEAEIVGEEEVQLSEEHSEFKWATKEEILKLNAENYLRKYFEGRE